MQKVLILGGSHRDIPLINAAKELGFYVITLGAKKHYKGHSFSNKAYMIDFNDFDAVREVIDNEKVDYLVPGCGEESYLNTVKLADEYKIGNFDKIEIAKLIHNKWKFKKFCLKNGISVPKGLFYDKELDLDLLNFPIVVKPTNLSGGRGIEIAHTKEELQTVLKISKQYTKEIFFEEFIEGELFAYSVFFINQKIIYSFFGKDESYLNPYLITTAYPTYIKKSVLQALKKETEILAKALRLVDGMFHMQVIVKDDKAYIIDVTRRIPGDLYPYLIEFCNGIKYSKAVIQAYLGNKIPNEFFVKRKNEFIIRYCIMPSKNGIYKDIFIDKGLENKVIYKFDLIEKEVYIDDFLHTQISIIFLKLDKQDKEILKNITNLIYAKIKT